MEEAVIVVAVGPVSASCELFIEAVCASGITNDDIPDGVTLKKVDETCTLLRR
jgi:hypothetical protein